jgi:hypothetical protein
MARTCSAPERPEDTAGQPGQLRRRDHEQIFAKTTRNSQYSQ